MRGGNVERDFKGVWIPKEIWLSKELSPMEKFFFIEISSLDCKKGCFASNAHFSELFGITTQRCSQIIHSLESKGWIKTELIRKGKQVIKRMINVSRKFDRGIKKTFQGYQENVKGTNTKEHYNHKDIRVFSEFYDNYPKKGTKAEAKRFWLKMTDDKKELAVNGILNHTSGKEKTFMVDAIRYLRNERWEDEINIEGKNNGTYQQTLTPQQQLENSISETEQYIRSLQGQ